MKWRLHRTDLADADLIDIWNYIAADNPVAAGRQIEKLTGLFESTLDFPRKGRPVPELSPGHRILQHGSYLLIYHLDEANKLVTLIRVVHAARDWLKLFSEGDLD